MGFLSSVRLGVFLVAVVTACSSTTTTTSTNPPSTTPATLAANTTNAPATTVPAPPADLMVEQILLRYDGQQEFGSLEVTVCNTGEGSAAPSAVSVTVSGAQFAMPTPGEIVAGSCADVFDPATDFSSFGITTTGDVAVSAAITTLPSLPSPRSACGGR